MVFMLIQDIYRRLLPHLAKMRLCFISRYYFLKGMENHRCCIELQVEVARMQKKAKKFGKQI